MWSEEEHIIHKLLSLSTQWLSVIKMNNKLTDWTINETWASRDLIYNFLSGVQRPALGLSNWLVLILWYTRKSDIDCYEINLNLQMAPWKNGLIKWMKGRKGKMLKGNFFQGNEEIFCGWSKDPGGWGSSSCWFRKDFPFV